MALNSRAKILNELVSEFVEERVRQAPPTAFHLAAVKQSLHAMMQDAGSAIEFKSADDEAISAWLDQHPFLLAAGVGAGRQWRPGLKKAGRA